MPTNKHQSLIVRDEHDEGLLAKRVSLASAATIYAVTDTTVSLATVDVQIGAVEIKDKTTDRRASVNVGNELEVALKSGATVTPYGNVTVTQSGRATVAWESGATVAISNLPDVDIDDISKGTQTNDVKVTLDSEKVGLTTGTSHIGLATVDVGTNKAWSDPGTYIGLVSISGDLTLTSGTTVAVSNLPVLPTGANYVGLATVDVGNWPASQTVDWLSGATVAVSDLPDVDIDDISKGTQTNDVKVTLDSEAVILGAGTAAVGFATVAVGSAATLNAVVNLSASQTVDWLSGATVAVSNLPALPTGANYVGLATVDVGSSADLDINDVSKGTQTNDVKVTLDSEAVTLGAGTAAVGFATVAVGESLPAGTNEIGKLAAGVAGIGFATVSNPDHEYSYAYTSGPTTDWIVKGSAGFLHAVHVGTAVASSIIEVSDHASDGDAAVKLYQAGDTIGPAVYPLNMTMGTGITLDITNQTHVTVIYR